MRRALAVVFATLLTLSAACGHAVVIDSDPPGADIKINGDALGPGPVTYNETTGWEKVYDIEASKAGFKTTRKQLKQTEWNIPVVASAGVCSLLLGTPATIVGALPLVGLFWARQLPDKVTVSLDKGGTAPTGTPEGGTPPSSYGY
ncbi:MAG: PEGA domain-containing protein [Deltaproteobacteria bacterium]|nr:PEGA domain-containing protein [Deltaproteobacteria bacterium]